MIPSEQWRHCCIIIKQKLEFFHHSDFWSFVYNLLCSSLAGSLYFEIMLCMRPFFHPIMLNTHWVFLDWKSKSLNAENFVLISLIINPSIFFFSFSLLSSNHQMFDLLDLPQILVILGFFSYLMVRNEAFIRGFSCVGKFSADELPELQEGPSVLFIWNRTVFPRIQPPLSSPGPPASEWIQRQKAIRESQCSGCKSSLVFLAHYMNVRPSL